MGQVKDYGHAVLCKKKFCYEIKGRTLIGKSERSRVKDTEIGGKIAKIPKNLWWLFKEKIIVC